jgi:hypothetical protein
MQWHLASFLAGILATYMHLTMLPGQLTAVPLQYIAGVRNEQQIQGLIGSAHGVLSFLNSDSSSSSTGISRSLLSGSNISIALQLSSSSNSSEHLNLSGRQLKYQGGGFNAGWRQEYSSFKSRWHPTVMTSVFKAQQKLTTTIEQRAGRLFVPMLSNRHSELCCMLTDLDSKVGGANALDVFIFTVDNKAQAVYNRSPCWKRQMNITVVFLPLDEHWGVEPECSSSAIHDMNGWIGMPGLFGENYRRMGHWRLTFQFAFADMLGYKYLWQLDDDSFFRSPVNFSMIQYMQEKTLWIAGGKTLPDPHFVTWGLPELARFFLVGERMAPTGTLFSNHTQPSGLDGLYTLLHDPVRTQHPLEGDPGGWSRTIIHGNNMIIDMDRFWWPKQAQKFVELVIQTGYHWRFRWNEQGVIAMLWQIFVPEGNFEFDTLPVDYHHPRKTWGTCADP